LGWPVLVCCRFHSGVNDLISMRSMAAIGSTNSPFHSGDRLRVDELFVRHGSAANETSLADAFDMQLATATDNDTLELVRLGSHSELGL